MNTYRVRFHVNAGLYLYRGERMLLGLYNVFLIFTILIPVTMFFYVQGNTKINHIFLKKDSRFPIIIQNC